VQTATKTKDSIDVVHMVAPGYKQGVAVARVGHKISRVLNDTEWKFRLPTICVLTRRGTHMPVKRANWRRVRLRRGDSLMFLSRPLGGLTGGAGGGNKALQIGGIIAMIALTAIAGPIGTWVAGAGVLGLTGAALTFGGALIAAGIVMGGALLLSTFLRPDAPAAQDDKTPQIYSLNVAGNAARLLQTIPVGYGSLKTFPDYAQSPFSEYSGDDQLVNVLLCIGAGKYRIDQILLDDTPLWDPTNGLAEGFSDIDVAVYLPGQTVTLFPTNIVQAAEVSNQTLPDPAGIDDGWLGGFIVNEAGSLIDAIAIDLGALLIHTNPDGTISSATVAVECQYRPVNNAGAPTGPYVGLFNTSYTGASNTPKRFTEKRTTSTPGRYQVRLRRTTPLPTDNATRDDITWLGLRGFLVGDSSFTYETTVALRIKATAQISQASSRRLAVIWTRILPVWNGVAMVEQPTRSAAWAAYDIATNTIYNSNPRPPNKMDFAEFVALDALGTSLGHYFDFQFVSTVPIPDAIDKALRILMAKHRWAGDMISITREQLRTVPNLMLSDRQIVRGSISIKTIFQDENEADAVIVEYLDREVWQQAEAQFPPETQDFEAQKPRRIRVEGATERPLAFVLAAFYFKQATLRRQFVTLDTELDGRLLNLGSLVRVQSELPQTMGFSGEVLEQDGHNLTLDVAPEWSNSLQNYIGVRTKTGKYLGPIKCTKGEADNVAVLDATDLITVETARGITLEDALDRQDGSEGPTFDFGFQDNMAENCVVLTGRPNGNRVTLALVIDDPGVYDTDLGDLPDDPGATPLFDPGAPVISGILASFRTNILEPTLDVSWWPAAGAYYYVVDISYDNGTTWEPFYQGGANSYSKMVSLAFIKVRVAGVGKKHGTFSITTVEPPSIDLKYPVVGLPGLIPALEDQVTRAVDEFSKRTKSFEQWIANYIVEIESGTMLEEITGKRNVVGIRGDLIDRIETVIADLHLNYATTDFVEQAGVTVVAAAATYTDGALANLQTSINTNFATKTFATTGDVNTLAQAASYTDGSIVTLGSSISATYETKTNVLAAKADAISQALVNTNSAISTYNNSVSTSYGGLTATVNGNFTAVATISGRLAAQWTVTLDVNGYVTGVKAYNDGSTSQFIIITDDFLIAKPGVSGGSPVTIFQISNVGGSPKVVIKADVLADGALLARMVGTNQLIANTANIANALITRLHVLGEEMTAQRIAVGSDYDASALSGNHTLCSITKTVGDGSVLLRGEVSFDYRTDPYDMRIRLYANGILQIERPCIIGMADNNPGGGGLVVGALGGTSPVSFGWLTLGGGSWTFDLVVVNNGIQFAGPLRAGGAGIVRKPMLILNEGIR